MLSAGDDAHRRAGRVTLSTDARREKEDGKGQLESHYGKTQFLGERVSGLAPPGPCKGRSGVAQTGKTQNWTCACTQWARKSR